MNERRRGHQQYPSNRPTAPHAPVDQAGERRGSGRVTDKPESPIVTLPGTDMHVYVPNPEDREPMRTAFERRHEIAMAHCKAKGWPQDPAALTLTQILEIRALPEWQEAGR